MIDDRLGRCRAAVEQLATVGLAAARTDGHVSELLREIDAVVSHAAAGEGEGEPPVACGAGCAACCTIQVQTLAVEGAAIAAFLRRSLPADERAALLARLEAFHRDVRWLEDRERVRGGFRCPFLDARGACRVHPVRPLACRAVSSADAGDCARALWADEDDDDGAPRVRMRLWQRLLYDEAREVLRAAVRRRGLDARCRDVSGMAAAFLADPRLLGAYLGGAELPIV